MSSLLSLKSAGSSGVPQGFGSDIQGLRAVAVALVVIFHMFPNTVTGGYVGVDVFFVISGFLIPGLLIRQTERDGRVDFRDFYIRRARRELRSCRNSSLLAPQSTFIRYIQKARFSIKLRVKSQSSNGGSCFLQKSLTCFEICFGVFKSTMVAALELMLYMNLDYCLTPDIATSPAS